MLPEHKLMQIYDPNRKFKTLVNNSILFHNILILHYAFCILHSRLIQSS